MSNPGDYCRAHVDNNRPGDILGCSGRGRPSCCAPECLYGAEPCPNTNCNGFKAEGKNVKCNWCGGLKND